MLTGPAATGRPGRSGRRIAAVELRDSGRIRLKPGIEHERAVAIHDLILDGDFAPAAAAAGPYHLVLSADDRRMVFEIRDQEAETVRVVLALAPFRRIIRDYFKVCESHVNAARSLSPSRIEAIDMGRRGLHDEGSALLIERLAGEIEMDFATARRLFTLLCILRLRG